MVQVQAESSDIFKNPDGSLPARLLRSKLRFSGLRQPTLSRKTEQAMGHDYRSKRRVSLRRLKGKIILSLLPTYDLDGTKAGAQPVTIARKFRAENKINPPAVIRVVRNSYTTDEFFWSENGMFALRYAEFNWANFPALLRICRSEEFLEKLNEERKNMHDTVLDIEDYFPQYSYT